MEQPSEENKRLAQEAKAQGNDAYKKKQLDEALQHYERAKQLDPTDITFYTNLAAVHFEKKEYERCIELCKEGVEVGRENRADYKLIAKAFSRMGNAYRRMKDLRNAKLYYEKSMSEHRTPEVNALLSEVNKIIKEEERAAYINPELAEKERTTGNDLFKKGDFATAVKHYTEAIKRNPSDAKLFSNRAACYTKLAAFDLGLQDCDECVKLDPTFIKGWLRKGNILSAMGQTQKALDAFRKALDLDQNNMEAMNGMRACLTAAPAKNTAEARERALADPEVQQILRDPAMRIILEQMQADPNAVQEHLQNPDVASKISKLISAGLIAIH